MIHNLIIHYTKGNINYTLEVNTDYDNDNLPYDLAEAFQHIIESSNATPEIVINDLKSAFNYGEQD